MIGAAAWDAALDLAWTSYLAGSTPVGALVLDPRGQIVATGRSRRFEQPPPGGQLANCHVAHAEINALAGLPPTRSYADHLLVTTLEPCCMCVGAAVQSGLRQLAFAGRDPYGGASGLVIDTPQARGRALDIQGPEPGAAGFLAELLHVRWLADRGADRPLASQRALGEVYRCAVAPDTAAAFVRLRQRSAPLVEAIAAAVAAREALAGRTH